MKYWQPGEHCVYRGIVNDKVWSAMPVTVVQDTPTQTVLLLQVGARCAVPEMVWRWNNDRQHYINGTRWQDARKEHFNHWFSDWHSNYVLWFLEPEKYYASGLFWEKETGQLVGYYINFQLPFRRSRLGFDTLDLDLDIVIEPSHEWRWKDEEDYRMAVESGGILPEWAQGIEQSCDEVFERINNRLHPLDGSWLDWRPNPAWTLPVLPDDWGIL